MNAPVRGLVAGVGNVFLGDDGFGVEVARQLASGPLPDGVHAVDFGVRALHLAYELLALEGAPLVLVDAMSRGSVPGTLFVIEPDLGEEADDSDTLDAHAVNPARVLRMALGLGATLGPVRIVGCEPADVGEGMGLSAPVSRAVGDAVRLVQAIVSDLTDAFGTHGLGRTR